MSVRLTGQDRKNRPYFCQSVATRIRTKLARLIPPKKMQELDMAMITKLYGSHYDIEQLFVSPSDSGHDGVARERTYLILSLRKSVCKAYDVKALYEERVGVELYVWKSHSIPDEIPQTESGMFY